jgi:hypothetical protein
MKIAQEITVPSDKYVDLAMEGRSEFAKAVKDAFEKQQKLGKPLIAEYSEVFDPVQATKIYRLRLVLER